MTTEDVYKIGEKIYKSIWTSTQQPLRTFDELKKFMGILATAKTELTVLHDQLRLYITTTKKNATYDFSFNTPPAVSPTLEICRDSAKRGVDSISSIQAWYELAERHRTLNTLEANQFPRLQAVELLNKDIRPLTSIGYTDQFKPKYEIKTDLDYIYYLLPFLKSGKQSLELYQSIFGHGYIDIPDRLYLRLTDILYKNENSGLTRVEAQEYSLAGFDRNCITKFFEVLNTFKDKEQNADLKRLYEDFINDSYTNDAVKAHIPIV